MTRPRTRPALLVLLLLSGCRSDAPPEAAPVAAEAAASSAAAPPFVPPSPRPYPSVLGADGDPGAHAFWPVRPQRIDRIAWRYTGGEHMGMAMPEPPGDRVFVQAGAGSVRSLDVATGNASWGGPGSPQFNYSSSVLGPGGRSYGSGFNALRCVDRDGALVWQADLDASSIHAPPAVSPDGKRVAFGGDALGLAVLDAETGRVRLRRAGSGSHNRYGFDDTGRLLLRTDEGVSCLDEEGNDRWFRRGGVEDFFFNDGVLYAAEQERVIAYLPAGGGLAWERPLKETISGIAWARDRGEIVVALRSGELAVLGLDGTVRRRTRISQQPLAPPAAAPGGEAVVADGDGVVFVVGADGGVLAKVETGEGPHWSWGGRPVLGPDGCVYLSQKSALLRLVGPPAATSPAPRR